MSAVESMLRDIEFKKVVVDSVVPESEEFWTKIGYRKRGKVYMKKL